MRYIKPIVALAGLGSFLAGWLLVEKEAQPAPPAAETTLIIRPVDSLLEAESSSRGEEPGQYLSPSSITSIKIAREGWPTVSRDLKSSHTVVAFRVPPPPAKLKATNSTGSPVSLRTLPSKELLKPEAGYVRLTPGPYELLAESEGYVPERLSLELEPGSTRLLKLHLKALIAPMPQSWPSSLPQPGTSEAVPAPTNTTPRAPQPVPYREPVVVSPPPTIPQPRFTPVTPKPAPLFTPLP